MRPLSFLDPNFARDPWPTYARLRNDSPVWLSEEIGMLCTFGHPETREVLISTDYTVEYPFRVSQQVFGKTLLDMDGPEHQRLRGHLATLFSTQNVKRIIESVVEAEVLGLVESLAGREAIDFVRDVAEVLPLRTTCRFLGVPRDLHQLVGDRLPLLLKHLDGSRGDFASVSRAREELEALLREAIASKARPAHRALQDLDGLSAAERLRMTMLLLAAGVETSVCSIGNTMSVLLRHPVWIERSREEPAVLRSVVDEAVRWEPPQHDTVRFARVDTELYGHRVQQGQAVKLVLASANRDERVFPNGESFAPGRDTSRSLSFGHGRHACLGRLLALRQIEAVMQAFLGATTSFAARAGNNLEPEGNTFRAPRSLPLYVEWREGTRPRRGQVLSAASRD